MKSPVRRKKIDNLILKWDHKARSSSSSHLRKKAHFDEDKQQCLDEYFKLLEEIKPHIKELRHTKIFDKPFNCFIGKI